jgi:hypothetical protein
MLTAAAAELISFFSILCWKKKKICIRVQNTVSTYSMGLEKPTQQYVNSLKSTAHVILPMQKCYLFFKKQLNFPLVYLCFDHSAKKTLDTPC